MDFKNFFQDKDLKKSPRIGIHYEQKTTPDLLWCVSKVILELTENNKDLIFSDEDIRHSHIFNELMQNYFSKPPQHLAENEYNKVSSYQLGLLSYAGIIEQVNQRPKKYKIRSGDVLKYMAINDFNASSFLTEYTEKLLIDNGLITYFEQYKNNPNQTNHLIVKERYLEWARSNTAVRGLDPKHTYRVFNKIFNVYCYKHRIPGEDGSKIINGPCPYSFLIYNRTNFRDEDMPSGMTRREYQEKILTEIDTNGVVGFILVQKAKDEIRNKYNGTSEIQEPEYGFIPNSGVHIHHILPQWSYPQFKCSRENLIALTPGQHLSSAHVKGNTQKTDPIFQKLCLKKKFKHIKESLNKGESFYKLEEFIKILDTALNLNLIDTSTLDQVNSAISAI